MKIDLTISNEQLEELYNSEAKKRGDDRNNQLVEDLGALLCSRLKKEKGSNEVLIDGVIIKTDDQSVDQVTDMFIEWVESKGLSFGGSIRWINWVAPLYFKQREET